jgi:hypothetical protein
MYILHASHFLVIIRLVNGPIIIIIIIIIIIQNINCIVFIFCLCVFYFLCSAHFVIGLRAVKFACK